MSNITPKKSKLVRKHWSQVKQPSKRRLEALRRAARGSIDTADSPPVTQADLDAGRVRILRRPSFGGKQSLTIRLDEDLVAWFKAQGQGYQTRINQALREYRTMHGRDDDPKAALDKIAALAERLKSRVA